VKKKVRPKKGVGTSLNIYLITLFQMRDFHFAQITVSDLVTSNNYSVTWHRTQSPSQTQRGQSIRTPTKSRALKMAR